MFVIFIFIVGLDLSLNESEPNMTVTEEEIMSVTSLPSLLKPGILYFRINCKLFKMYNIKSVECLHNMCYSLHICLFYI